MRGALAVLIAKLVFMAAGYVLVGGLTRLLTKEQFGDYGVVFGVASLVNMVVVQGTMQSVSRSVASAPEGAGSLWRQALRIQLVLVSTLVVAVFVAAPALARSFRDEGLAAPMRLALGVTALYGLYAVNVGVLNGRKQLVRQAALDMCFSVLRVTGMLVAAGVGLGVIGIVGGFVCAAGVILLASFIVLGRVPPSAQARALSTKAFLRESVTLMGAALVLNGLLQGDLFVLKIASDPAVADAQAGLYTAAQQIARIPYYVMAAAAIVLFPAVASLSSAADERRRASMIAQSFTGVLGLVVGMAAVTAPIGSRILSVLYPESYAPAAATFSLLVIGLVMLTAANIGGSMVAATGRARPALIVLLIALVVQVTVAALCVPRLGTLGAGLATAAAGAVTLVLDALLLHGLGARFAPRAFVVPALGAALAAAFVIVLGDALPQEGVPGKLVTVGIVGAGYALYLLVLVLGGTLLGIPGDRSRVLLVTKPLEPPFNDGSKVLARALAARLPPDAIAILTTKKGRTEAPAGVQTAAVYGGTSSFVPRGFENVRVLLYLFVARTHYRALHFFFAPNPLTNRAVRVIRMLSPGLPVVQTVMSRPRSYDAGAALVFGDVVVAHSQHTARQLEEASGVRVTTIRPGVEIPPEELRADRRAQARSALGLEEGAYALLFAGDIDEGGALDHLRDIVPGVLQDHAHAVFLFSVRTKHGPSTRARAEGFVSAHLAPFGARVKVYFDHAPFSVLLDAADAMVLPAEHTLAKVDAPLVALEQMARGVPVFLLRRPPLDEIPPPALRERLLGDDAAALRERIGAHARGAPMDPALMIGHIREHFSLEDAARRYQEIHARL